MKQTFKRWTALILALSMCLSLLCSNAWATERIETDGNAVAEELISSATSSTVSSGDWTYYLSDNRAIITKYTGTGSVVVIPSYLDGYKVTKLAEKVFENNYKLLTVTIPENIQYIGSRAFANCYNLQTIYYNAIESSVYYMRSGMNAHVFVNAGADSDSFSVVFGNKVKTIPTSLFEAPENSYAHVTKVVIPDSVETIKGWAFSGCKDLKDVQWGNGIKKIEEESFQNCYNLRSVTIPKSVQYIGSGAFKNCYLMKTLNFNAADCDVYYFRSRMEGHVFVNAGADSGGISVIFGEGVTTIPTSIFEAPYNNYVHVKDIVIPNSVTNIQSWSFNNCLDLKRITIKSKNINISEDNFSSVNSGLVIECYRGSTAETYAKKNGYKVSYLAPSKPTLSGVSNTKDGVKVTWKASSGAQGYYIYRKTGSESWSKIGSATGTSYTDKAASSGKTYSYTVKAYSGSTVSSYDTTGKTITRLTTPSISSVSNAKGKKMTVKWKKNTIGSGYEIQYSTKKDFSSGNKSVTIGKNSTVSKTITGLTKGKTYYVRIRTYKTVSSVKYYSGWSAVKSVKISK